METTTDITETDDIWFDEAAYSSCPACGSPMDYCQGHGPMGDPAGFDVLIAHDEGNHYGCHPDGCDGGF